MVARLGGLTGTLLLVAMSFYAAIAVASPATAGRPFAHKLLPGSAFVPVGESANADGTFADTWAKGGARVSVTGGAGLVVSITSITQDGISITQQGVAVSPQPMDKLQPNAGANAAQAYRAAGRSVVKDAIAVGVGPADAERLFGGGLNTSNLKSLGSSGATEGMGASYPALVAGQIIQSWCASITSPSGFVSSTACDTQVLDQDNGGGDWYIVDKQQDSGHSTDTNVWFPDRLTQITEKVGYSSGNGVVQWSPVSTNPQGSCSTVSYSITSGPTGLSYSQSFQVCPDNVGLYYLDTNTASTNFGTAWNGTESGNAWEGTGGVDLVHSPAGSCNCPSLYLTQAWRN